MTHGPDAAPIVEAFKRNRSQPFSLKNRTVIALLVVSNVLGNFTLSRGLHQVGRLISFSPWPYIHAFLNPLVAMGVFLRSPHAHALIESIDIKAAAALPGVAAIYIGADLAADRIGGP